ncbi:MAG: VTT domain-containing protein [Candidatus Micrarchaeia archaeon]
MNNKISSILTVIITLLIICIAFLMLDYLTYFESLGYIGAFLISLIGSATIIVPIPSWAIVFLMAKTLDPILLGVLAGTGSAIGELTGYYLGKGGTKILNKEKHIKKYTDEVDKYGAFAIFVFAFIPNPFFDIAGITAGAMHMKMWKFLLASMCGKILRFILFAYLGNYAFHMVF